MSERTVVLVRVLPKGVKPYADLTCDRCGGSTKVIDSRGSRGGIRRRRKCISCGERFTSYEARGELVPQAIETSAMEALMHIVTILKTAKLIE